MEQQCTVLGRTARWLAGIPSRTSRDVKQLMARSEHACAVRIKEDNKSSEALFGFVRSASTTTSRRHTRTIWLQAAMSALQPMRLPLFPDTSTTVMWTRPCSVSASSRTPSSGIILSRSRSALTVVFTWTGREGRGRREDGRRGGGRNGVVCGGAKGGAGGAPRSQGGRSGQGEAGEAGRVFGEQALHGARGGQQSYRPPTLALCRFAAAAAAP